MDGCINFLVRKFGRSNEMTRNPKTILQFFVGCIIFSVLALLISSCGYEDTTPRINFMVNDLPVYAQVDGETPICYIGAWDDFYVTWNQADAWMHVTSEDGTCSGWAWID